MVGSDLHDNELAPYLNVGYGDAWDSSDGPVFSHVNFYASLCRDSDAIRQLCRSVIAAVPAGTIRHIRLSLQNLNEITECDSAISAIAVALCQGNESRAKDERLSAGLAAVQERVYG